MLPILTSSSNMLRMQDLPLKNSKFSWPQMATAYNRGSQEPVSFTWLSKEPIGSM